MLRRSVVLVGVLGVICAAPLAAAVQCRDKPRQNDPAASGPLTRSEIAYRQGYSDQAHLIREFRRFSGVSPEVRLRSGNRCTRILLER